MSRSVSRRRWPVVVALAVTAAALSAQQQPRVPEPEPPTRGAPPPAALRPLVAGPNGGVSTGHPLITAAAFADPAQGRQRLRCRRRRRCSSAASSSRISTAWAAKRWCSSIPQTEKKVTSIVGQGWAPKAVDVDWYLSRGKTLRRRRPRSGGRARRAARRADRAREVGHDELRAGVGARDRVRGEGLPAAPAAPPRGVERQLEFFKKWPDNQTLLAEARRLDAQGRRDHQAADAGAHADADGRGRARAPRARAGPRASSPRAIGSTRATSPRRWWRSCRSTRRRSTLSDFAEYFARVEEPAQTTLSRLHRLQARVRQPGAGAAAGAQHPRALRPARR